jgi:hypothetical protein
MPCRQQLKGRLRRDFRWSRRAYFLLQAGRGQLPEVPEVERVNTFYRASCRAAQQQRIVDFRAHPSAAGHRVQCLQIILFGDRDDLKMRQDVLGDEARGFDRMNARLDRQASECSKQFRDRVLANKSLVLPPGDAQKRGFCLPVVRMALFGGRNENCRIEENIHLARLSKLTQFAPRAHCPGSAPSVPPVPRCLDGPIDHRL